MTKIFISKQILLNKLVSVSKIMASKPSLPIMDCVLLKADESTKQLTITATSTDGRITTAIEQVEWEGTVDVCIDAKLLINALKVLPEQPLCIEIGDDLSTVIRYHGGTFNLVAQRSAEFPVDNVAKDTTTIEIPTQYLIQGISQTHHFAAIDDLRPVMGGVFVECVNGELNFVATNGHLLSWHTFERAYTGDNLSFIIPRKIANTVKTLFTDTSSDARVTISLARNRAIFEGEGYKLSAVLIEGRFPNFRAVIPQDNSLMAVFNTELITGALSRTGVFMGSSKLLSFTFDKDKVLIASENTAFANSAKEEVACEYSSDGITIGFNGDYLHQIISTLGSDTFSVKMSSPERPAIIIPNDGTKSIYLITPLLTN